HRLQHKEELPSDPEAPDAVLRRVPPWGCSKKHEENMGCRNEGSRELIAEIQIERAPASGQSQGDQGGEKAQPQERCQAQRRSVAGADPPLLRAQPQRIARESDGKVDDAGQRRDVTMTAALVQVPELRLPGA